MTSHSIIQRYIIIWLNSDYVNENLTNLFDNIQHIVDSIKIFNNINECIQFFKTIKNEQIFFIISDSFDQQHIRIINLIEETNQIKSVYIFSHDSSKEQQWKTECKKFQGIFSEIEHICNSLQQNIRPCSTTSIISSMDTSNDQDDELDQSYIYSKLLTEIICHVKYNDKIKKESFDFCREYYLDNSTILNLIDEFEQDYQNHSPIWWYTKESSLIHSLLRDVLIEQDFHMMIKMGFFIKDLHQDIQRIYCTTNQTKKFIVYRGHGMSNTEFEQLIKEKRGLYLFKNFLSTSTDENVALHFASCAKVNCDTTGILFQIEIDPTIYSIPFASLDKISYYLGAENEILFSTHTIFRIREINQIEERLWKVNLTLTNQIGQKISFLIDQIRNEIQGINSWYSLAILLYKIGKYEEANIIFNKIIQMDDDNNKERLIIPLTSIYNNRGLMYDSMEDHSNALLWYQKSFDIQRKSLSSDEHPSLATVYNNIGMVYRSMGDYKKALLYCEKTLKIRLKSSSINQTSLITVYNNIGMIYESKGDYIIALSYYEKAYEIQKILFRFHHPSLIVSYNSFGGIYSLMGDYSKALSYYEKTFEIQENLLPFDHPSIAITYSNIGYVYQLMGNYNISLSYYKKAIKIQEQLNPSNQLSLAVTYNNIGLVYRLVENYPTALSYYEKALVIEQKFLSSNHPSLASTYNNLGTVYQSMKEYTTALTHYKKTLEIWQESFPSNHSSLATIHNNIGSVHHSKEDYQQALAYYEKTIEIQLKLPSSNQLDLAITYNNIGEVYRSMKDYPKALSYYNKTLEIEQTELSTKHPSLAITISNMAVAFDANNQYDEAFEYAQRALNIFYHAFGPNHSQTKENQKYLDQIRQKLLSKK